MHYFAIEEFEMALKDFEFVLYEQNISKTEMASALWCKFLCNASLNDFDVALQDWFDIQEIFLCKNISKELFFLAANFENPHERLTPDQCRERVRGTASSMKILAMKIKDPRVSHLVNFSISELENVAYDCCARAHWTECLDPIVDAWKKLKKSMDQGAALAPFVAPPVK